MCNDRIWILLTRKLSGEATLTELKELDLILEAEPQHRSTIENISGIWNNRLTPDDDFMEATYLAHLERVKEKGLLINNEEPLRAPDDILNTDKKSKRSFKWLALTFIVAAGVLTTTLLINSRKSVSGATLVAGTKEISTKNGNRTKLKLPDGTDVWLNAGSKLNYEKNFEGKTREVYLTGEAFFDVVHNAEQPFIIHTAKIDIKVLGTQFNVKAYSEDRTTETSLIRGSVEVFLKADPAKKYLLRPNEKLVLNNETVPLKGGASNNSSSISTNKVLNYTPEVAIRQLSYLNDLENVESSWTKNILSFDDEQFSEVAKKMERWYDVKILFKNKHWEKKHFSGSFESESLQQALEAIKYTTGFNFKINQNTVTIF